MESTIVRLAGSREEKIEAAKEIKRNLEQYLPEMAELRRQLIAAGMCEDNLSSVARVKTPEIDYLVTRDDPDRYRRKHAKPSHMTEEMFNAIQDRKRWGTGPTHPVPFPRSRNRSRT